MKVRNLRTTLAMSGVALAMGVLNLGACAPATPQTSVGVQNTQVAQAPEAPVRMSFIVSFRPSHALGQAQILQNAGRDEDAERLVVVTLRDNATLRGLCFEQFTVGGAELVLNVCAPDPFEDPLVTQDRWLEQLGATMGVAYVERNLVARPDASEAGPS